MASGLISSWHIDEETMKTVTDLILEGSKITADFDCSHEIKRHLLLGSKAMNNLDNLLQIRDITWLTKVCIVKAILAKIEGRRRRGRQDEMVGSHHRLDGHEFEQAPGVGDGKAGLVCCSPWGHKESWETELNLNGFSSSHVWMWELDHKECWVLKNWCF